MSNDIKFVCPHCNQHLEAPPEMLGTAVACPSCQKQIQVPPVITSENKMGLKCKLGFHEWSRCKCSKCGKTRDEEHDWRGCRCSQCGKTRDEGHFWTGCKCANCIKEQHDWSKNCELCCRCGETRHGVHDWSTNCKKCSKCGSPSDKGHDWSQDCEKCSKCGASRGSNHVWSGECDFDQCSKCGKVRQNAHRWFADKCERCGKTRDEIAAIAKEKERTVREVLVKAQRRVREAQTTVDELSGSRSYKEPGEATRHFRASNDATMAVHYWGMVEIRAGHWLNKQTLENLSKLEEAWEKATGEKLFKKAQSVAPQPDIIMPKVAVASSAASIHDRILQMLENHLALIRTERHKPTLEILEELKSRFVENTPAISAIVEQTLADRKLHTKVIGGGGIRTWLLVSVVPSDRFSSANFFAREYPPGYTGYMDFWLNSTPLKLAREMGHDVFAHVLVYADASTSERLSLGVSTFPLDPTKKDSNPLVIFPVESLTREEKATIGL